MGSVILDKVRLFWSRCGCSGKGAVVVDWVAGVLVWVKLFWVRCKCSCVDAGVLDKVR